MKIIKEKKWSYILMEDDRGWILTYMIGGAVEIDISVLLSSEEVNKIQDGVLEVEDLVEYFKKI